MRGFNLIELMIVIGVMGILVLVGLPNFQNMVASVQTRQARDSLYSDLMQARSTAVAQQRTVVFCGRALSGGDEVCNNSSDWNDGWIAFIDNNGDGQVDAGENLIRVRNDGAAGVNLGFINPSSTSGSDQQVRILASTGTVRAQPQGNFYFCSENGGLDLAWRMSVNAALRPLMVNNKDSAGVVTDAECGAVGG